MVEYCYAGPPALMHVVRRKCTSRTRVTYIPPYFGYTTTECSLNKSLLQGVDSRTSIVILIYPMRIVTALSLVFT